MDYNFTIKELAAQLKVSISTVRRLIKSGEIESFRVGPQGQLRVTEGAVRRMCARTMLGEATDHHAVEKGKSPATLLADSSRTPSSVRTITGLTRNNLRWTVLNADVNVALKTLPASSVNCAITSPPYYWQRDYEVKGQIGHEGSIEGCVSRGPTWDGPT